MHEVSYEHLDELFVILTNTNQHKVWTVTTVMSANEKNPSVITKEHEIKIQTKMNNTFYILNKWYINLFCFMV